MAKFNQMSSKKLNSLLENSELTAEERTEIEAVLAARESVHTVAPDSGLTEEEQKAIEAAEGDAPAPATKAKREAAAKMTDEERTALAEKLRAETVNHRCQVVPFNSLEWVEGVIVSVIEEKRTNKVMFAVKADDGRRIVKAHDSQLIKILDETVERVKKVRSNKKQRLDENGNPIEGQTEEPWTDEAIEEAVKEVISSVGKTISFPEAGALGKVEEGAAIVTGRIISLVPAKRTKSILYRIELDQEDATAPKKYAHKVTSNPALVLAEELDEEGKKINEAFVARRYKEEKVIVTLSPEEAFKTAEASLNKAKEALAKAQATFEKREAAYNAAKEAYEAFLNSEQPESSVEDEDLA